MIEKSFSSRSEKNFGRTETDHKSNLLDLIEEKPRNPVKWTSTIEKNIKNIGEKAVGYKIMHIKNAMYARKFYNYFMYLGICLGPLASLINGIGSVVYHDPPTIFSIISMCVSSVSGIVVGITKFGKFEEKSTTHKIAASKYTSLESNVRRQLGLGRNDRVDASQYHEWIGTSMDELFTVSPFVDNKIYKRYAKIARHKGMAVPDEYEDIININEEYVDIKMKEITNDTIIDVNENKDSDRSVSNSKHSSNSSNSKHSSSNSSPTLKGKTKIKRSNGLSMLCDIGLDKQIEYQLKKINDRF